MFHPTGITPAAAALRAMAGGGGAAPAPPTLSEVAADAPLHYWTLQGDGPLADHGAGGAALTPGDPAPTAGVTVVPGTGLPMRAYGGRAHDAGPSVGAVGGGSLSFGLLLAAPRADKLAVFGTLDVGGTFSGVAFEVHAGGPESPYTYVSAGVTDGETNTRTATYDGPGEPFPALVHLGLAYDGDGATLRLYLDGAEAAVSAEEGPMGAVPAHPLYLGQHPGSAPGFYDLPTEVAHAYLVPAALSAARWAAHAAQALGT